MNRKTTNRPQSKATGFPGFALPRQNWFKMPMDWTDNTARMTSLAELKLVEYVLKHTWGFQEYGILKRITTDEFMHGRKRADGTRVDCGTGLSKQSVIVGLRSAVSDGFLDEKVDNTDRGRIKKSYSLKIRPIEESPQRQVDTDVKNLDIRVKNLDAGVKDLDSSGQKFRHRTEKDTLERKPLTGIFHGLKDLEQPKEKTEYIAQCILDQLGDEHSKRFYRLVAAKVPESVIRQALAEVKVDETDKPARLFTHIMKKYAAKH